MSDSTPHPSSITEVVGRRLAILSAAGEVLLRFGYRKASVDEVARVAGVSRQGVYLHFATKDALFTATIEYLLDQSIRASRAALSAAGVPLEERILNAFEAMAQGTLATHLDEVLEAAERLTGTPAKELEGMIVAEFITALESSPVSSVWRRHGDDSESVALVLYATSAGYKRLASSPADYVEKMRRAIRFICTPTPRKREKP
jgi:AcrR family transcriptional regulator